MTGLRVSCVSQGRFQLSGAPPRLPAPLVNPVHTSCKAANATNTRPKLSCTPGTPATKRSMAPATDIHQQQPAKLFFLLRRSGDTNFGLQQNLKAVPC